MVLLAQKILRSSLIRSYTRVRLNSAPYAFTIVNSLSFLSKKMWSMVDIEVCGFLMVKRFQPYCCDNCDLPKCVLNPVPGYRKHWLQLKTRQKLQFLKIQFCLFPSICRHLCCHLDCLWPDLNLLERLKERQKEMHLLKILIVWRKNETR